VKDICLLKEREGSKRLMSICIAIVLLSMNAFSATGGLIGWLYYDGEAEEGSRMAERTIAEVLKDNTDDWMAIPGVEGTAIGLFEDKPCIKIFSSRPAEQLRPRIPSAVEGYVIIIEETGTFRPLER
jgi:hypothetical protein